MVVFTSYFMASCWLRSQNKFEGEYANRRLVRAVRS